MLYHNWLHYIALRCAVPRCTRLLRRALVYIKTDSFPTCLLFLHLICESLPRVLDQYGRKVFLQNALSEVQVVQHVLKEHELGPGGTPVAVHERSRGVQERLEPLGNPLLVALVQHARRALVHQVAQVPEGRADAHHILIQGLGLRVESDLLPQRVGENGRKELLDQVERLA